MKKIVMVLAVIGLLAGAVLPASPAAAAGAGVADCSVTVNPWPGSGTNDPCVGTAIGVFSDGANTIVCGPGQCSLNASVANYSELCFANEPPLQGSASGEIVISNGVQQIDPDYSWTRLGVVAVITTTGPTGAGVAAFVPQTTALPTCAVPGPLPVRIIGLALFA